MSLSRHSATLLLALGLFAAGTACRKPAPVPAPEPQKPVPSTQDADQARRDEAARRKAEADRQQAEKDRLEAARKAEADKQAAFKAAAAKALQDIHFAYDDSGLSEASKAQLALLADFLKANPQVSIAIEGNCDERGTVEYNLALGERRSHEAFAYLKGLGVAEGRMSTVSFGKEKPICTESVEACWSRNRRDHFSMKP